MLFCLLIFQYQINLQLIISSYDLYFYELFHHYLSFLIIESFHHFFYNIYLLFFQFFLSFLLQIKVSFSQLKIFLEILISFLPLFQLLLFYYFHFHCQHSLLHLLIHQKYSYENQNHYYFFLPFLIPHFHFHLLGLKLMDL